MSDPRTVSDRGDVDAFDIREPLRILRRVVGQHRLIVCCTCVLTVALVVVFMKLRPPVYESSVTLLSESETDLGRQNFYEQWNLFRKDDTQSEPHLLAGGVVLSATMDKLDLGWDDVYHGAGSQFGHWWGQSWLGKRYRALKQRFFPKEKSAYDLTPEQRERVLALIDFKDAVSFEGINETHVGKLKVRGPTKQVGEIANTIVQTYLEQRTARHKAEAQKAYDALTEQVDLSRQKLLGLEDMLETFRLEHDIWLDFEAERSHVSQWTQMEMEMLMARSNLARSRAELAEVDRQLDGLPVERRTASTHERNALRESLQSNLTNTRLARVASLQRFNPDSPEIHDLDDRIAAIEAELAKTDDMVLASEATQLNTTREDLLAKRNELVGSIAGTESSLAVMDAAYVEHQKGLESLPEEQRTLQAMVRETQLADSEYRVLVDKQIQARVSTVTAGLTTPSIRIMEPAQTPDDPVWPNTKFMLVGAAIFGLFLGVGAAWLRDAMDNRVRRHHLTGGRGTAPLLGSVRVGGDGRVRVRGAEGEHGPS